MTWERKKVITEVERELEYLSPHTVRQYRAHIGDYLDFVGANREWADRDTLYNYIGKLRKRELSQQHITYILRGPLSALFRAHALKLPAKVPKFRGPQVDLSQLVSYSEAEVVAMINAVKESGDQQWRAYLALSTTFGLRASEIRQLRQQDVKKNTVMVYTLKEGKPREHKMPQQIAPYVIHYDYPFVSEGQMFIIFDEIRQAAGLLRVPRKSWHAIRHSVLTYLLFNAKGKVSESIIYNFMRWRGGGMFQIYFSPQAFEEDEQVYPIHPYLKYWG